MTIELLLCIVFAVIAYPVSRGVFVHYVAFAMMNLAFLGTTTAGASLLAMSFGALAAVDAALIITGSTFWLIPAFAASTALAIESVSNGDSLLTNITSISVVTNSVIIAHLAWEYLAWMRGKHGR